MIKTEYLGWKLYGLRLFEADAVRDKDEWRACYVDTVVADRETHGHGHTPEAALADAQKQIKKADKE